MNVSKPDTNGLTDFDSTKTAEKSYESEEAFLASYSIEKYDRPSVAADIAAFSLQTEKEESYKKNPQKKLSILLIKRGEHPFIDKWALPGGFLKKNETIEECAMREIKEETNISPIAVYPVKVFSEPDRDPRGRIISHSFATVISEENAKIMSGEDAADAKWFNVSLNETQEGLFNLSLNGDGEKIEAVLKRVKRLSGSTDFEVISNGGLAFDHAKIIACSILLLKKEAEDIDFVFGFLPEKFTLATLQMVQETMTGVFVAPPNFRRKFAGFVTETGEINEGPGHRPAKLYRKKG